MSKQDVTRPRAAAPIASGRVCRDWGEWHARVPDDILGEVYDLGGIDGEDVLMADVPPAVAAAYLSMPLPRGAAA